MRIKEKQVEDQLGSVCPIHQLKHDLAAKDHQLQNSKLEWEREQQSLQLLLEQEEAANNELQVYTQVAKNMSSSYILIYRIAGNIGGN